MRNLVHPKTDDTYEDENRKVKKLPTIKRLPK